MSRAYIGLKNILIVDDEQPILDLLRKQCEKICGDVNVIESNNGVDALTKINNQKFDLIITDYLMNRMNGVELTLNLEKLRDPRNMPDKVLILTGAVDEEIVLPEGNNRLNFMKKPFTPQDIVDYLDANFDKNTKHIK